MKTGAFTGYRLSEFSFNNDEAHPDCMKLKNHLFCETLRLTREGVQVFWSGLDLGVDTWAAECVLQIKATLLSRGIQLCCAIPHDEQTKFWTDEQKARYEAILRQADKVHYVNHDYYEGCELTRNQYMVDQSSYLIAVYDGKPGGTMHTVNYARKKGLKVTIIRP